MAGKPPRNVTETLSIRILMAKLTSKQRAKLPTRDFGLPEKARSDEAEKETGNYPIPDKSHAISAERLSSQQRKAGNLTRDGIRADQPQG